MPRPRPIRQATDTEHIQTVLEQNPWQEVKQVPETLAPPAERPLARALWRAMLQPRSRRFEVILGPRRVGKTTTMYQTVRALLKAGVPTNRLWWLRLDHPQLLRRSLDESVRLVLTLAANADQDNPVYLFLDELIYARDWDLWLKTFYDEQYPIRVLGSSSSTAALQDRRQESGIGRWEEQYLAPYLLPEYLSLVGVELAPSLGASLAETIEIAIAARLDVSTVAEHRRRYLLTGGFPELLLSLESAKADETTRVLESQRTLRSDAVERAVYKDIPQAYGVDRPMLLERTLYVLAEQATGLLSPTSLCRELDGLSQPTFEKYLLYLERAFLVFALPNYSGSERGVQKRYRKLYFVDGAVRNAALQRGLRPLSDPVEMGLLLENAAAAHLHALAKQAQVRLYHWRDGADEVDLILDDPRGPVAFEIGMSLKHHRRGLAALCSRHPRFKGRCYLVSPDAVPISAAAAADGIGTIPLDMLLLCAGAQAHAELARRMGPLIGGEMHLGL